MKENGKRYSVNFQWFYILWGVFFFSLVLCLFYFQKEISSPKLIHLHLDGPEDLVRPFDKNIIEELKKEIDELRETISIVSLVISLFGLLVTAISIFFSLRESVRVDNMLNEYKQQLKDKIDSVSGLETKLQNGLQSLSQKENELQKIIDDSKDSPNKKKHDIGIIIPNDIHNELKEQISRSIKDQEKIRKNFS